MATEKTIDDARMQRLANQMDQITKNTTAQTLRELARSEFGSIRMGVAQHPNADKDTLIYLYNKDPEDSLIRGAWLSTIYYNVRLEKSQYNKKTR